MAQPLIVPTAPKLESQKDSEEVRKSLLDLASKINEAILGTGREISDEALTADQKSALAGTDGTPSATNPYVTDSDPRLSGSSPYLPTADEKAALAGSYGSPSASNKYVTEIDPLFTVVASTRTTLYEDASATTTTSTGMVKLKEFPVYRIGTATLSFGLRNTVSASTVAAQIYKNGTAIGTLRTTSSTTVQTFVENIAISRGDLVQIYGRRTISGSCEVSQVLYTGTIHP